MPRHAFSGYRPFLDAASAALGGVPVVTDVPRMLAPLAQVAYLLGQAVEHADDRAVPVAVAEAEKCHALLEAAAAASRAMIRDVRAGVGLAPPDFPEPPEVAALKARVADLESQLAAATAPKPAAVAKAAPAPKG